MLKKLRKKKTAKRVWIVLAILIVPAFVLWGSGSLIRSKQETAYAGKIFGRKVSFLEYKDALDAVRNQATIQFGDNFSEIQKYLNLESQAWDRLILLTEAKKQRVSVSDKEVTELIASYPFFQRKGKFDNATYSQLLEYVFHTQPRVFEEQTRQNIMLSKLYKNTAVNINLTDEEIKKEYQKANEQISIYYIASLYSDFAKDITSSGEQIKEYFTKNALPFKRPPSFNIEYISLEDKDETATKDKIKNLFLRLNRKEGFIKVAKDFNLALKETGWFSQTDPIPGIGWSPQILNLISKTKTGQLLPPILIDKYYYIIRIKEKREPYIPDFKDIQDKVKEVFIKDESKRLAKEKIEDCLKKLKEMYQLDPQSIDFEQTAKSFGLKTGSTQTFKYGSYIEGIGASDNFWMSALELKDNEFSKIINVDLSGFYIIKVKSRVPVDEKKIAAEKTEFGQGLLLQKKQEYFSKFLEELKIRAQRDFKD